MQHTLLSTHKTTLVVSTFPQRKDGSVKEKDFSAMGAHGLKIITKLAKHRQILVLAEKMGREGDFEYKPGIFVKRAWEKGNPFSLASILWEAIQHENIDSLYIPFEFSVFGGIVMNTTLLAILGIAKLMGKRVVFELHQVVDDLSTIESHIYIKNPLITTVLNTGLKVWYSLLGAVSNEIIVFEESLKKRLNKYVHPEKTHVLSLFTEKKKLIEPEKAKKRLKLKKDELTVLVFGYINGYKGIDWIISQINKKGNKKIRLIIAGGKNPYQKGKPDYDAYVIRILEEAQKNPNILLTGFVPEHKIGLYFAAADVVVLPYTAFMSASGPFSIALSYGKPVLLSEMLLPYRKSKDFIVSAKRYNLKKEDQFFKLHDNSFLTLLHRIRNNKKLSTALQNFSVELSESRLDTTIAEKINVLIEKPIISMPSYGNGLFAKI